MQFEIKERHIRCLDDSLLIGDNADYTASFTFDLEWDGLLKAARFERISDRSYKDVLIDDNNCCTIPVNVLKAGFIRVGVFSQLLTTTYCEVQIKESIKENGGSPNPPSGDVYSQLIALIEEAVNKEIPQEQLEEAVKEYLSENPIETLTQEDVQEIVAALGYATEQDLSGKADINHNHDSAYSAKEHEHTQYLTQHQDISGKADINHNHDSAYAKLEHSHSEYLTEIPAEYATKEYVDEAVSEKMITITDGGEVAQSLAPNVFYQFTSALTALTITLEAASGYAEYNFSFITDVTGCTLGVPESVLWDGDSAPTIDGGKKYEVSILGGVAVISKGAIV